MPTRMSEAAWPQVSGKPSIDRPRCVPFRSTQSPRRSGGAETSVNADSLFAAIRRLAQHVAAYDAVRGQCKPPNPPGKPGPPRRRGQGLRT
jgi:hypothetical protein